MIRAIVIAAALGAVIWLLAARMLGPSDLWDQSQPLTVAYTTDMLVNGNWVLPRARGTEPATKPPLYNWLAAPVVSWLGFDSELAHKIPSVLALIGCVWLVVSIGQRHFIGNPDVPDARMAGWLAAVMLVASYPLFKLGFLARPDMLLTWWLLVAWWAGTRLLLQDGASMWWLRLIFWLTVAAAGLTKGPAAVLPVLFIIVGGRMLCGTWRAGMIRIGWWWGLPLALAINVAWLFAVWRINPSHLVDTMWAEELLGRVTGTGDEGARQGPIELLTGILDMPAYFLVRFAPWSVAAIAAIVAVVHHWRRSSEPRSAAMKWRMSAALFVVMVLVVMSLSAGKRADYIAPAYPMAALLGSWWITRWICRLNAKQGRAAVVVVVIIATMTLGILAAVNQIEPNAPERGFSDGIEQFVHDAADAINSQPAPVRFCWTGETHVQAMLGASHEAGRDAVFGEMQHGRPFWVVAGLKTSAPHDLAGWMAMRGDAARLTVVVQSAQLVRDRGWPEQMMLYWLEPETAE